MNQNKLLGLIIAVAVLIVVLLLITSNTHKVSNNTSTDINITKINDSGYAQALNQLDNSDINVDINNSDIVDVGQ